MKRILVAILLNLIIGVQVADLRAESATPASVSDSKRIAVEDFFRTPNLINPVLSPDGRFIAVGVAKSRGRVQLVVFDLKESNSDKIVASFGDADVIDYHWVNTERLVFSVMDLQSGDSPLNPGLWAVNRDGSDYRKLIHTVKHPISMAESASVVDRTLPAEWRFHSTVEDDSADVLVQAPSFNNVGQLVNINLFRLNTHTGRTQNLSVNAPANTISWLTDQNGQPVALSTRFKGRAASYLRTENGWKLWKEAEEHSQDYAKPFWTGPNKELIVLARRQSDTLALYEVDPTTLKLADQPFISTPGYDFSGYLVYDTQAKRVMGVHYETDAHGTVWMDPAMRALQAQIDKLLPGTINRIDCRYCASTTTFLISASSDRLPPVYYLYHRENKKLQELGASRPWIQAAQMGMRDLHRFTARDGLSIPVLVTQPAKKSTSPRPAVILVHGGPWVRGTRWEWERSAQFLASRGYVVIEPEFRGSTGFGSKHMRAGWKQWGLAMQDDLADALQWAVKQGWVDSERVCIAGASYGGYATLMGLVKHPTLYRCGINWVGVTDINLMYSINWSDASDAWKQYGMPLLIGDPVKDAQQLKDTSPLEQAARVKAPLLMAYGGRDLRVPLKHGTAFKDAVSKTNSQVEWIVYPNEGHGWRELATNVDFWSRVEKFLDTHIGPNLTVPKISATASKTP